MVAVVVALVALAAVDGARQSSLPLLLLPLLLPLLLQLLTLTTTLTTTLL